MFRFLALWLVILSALPLSAADVLLNTTGAKPGRYILTIADDGSVSVGPFSQVIDLSLTPPGPNPPPGPGPTPPPLTERGKAVQSAASKVTGDADRAGTAHGLAEIYRQIAAIVDANPTTTPASLTTALSSANNAFLAKVPPDNRNVLAQWQPVRETIGTYWTGLAAQGAPVASYSALLKECAAGLDSSATWSSEKPSISPDMLKLILMIIQIIMQLLQPQPVVIPH